MATTKKSPTKKTATRKTATKKTSAGGEGTAKKAPAKKAAPRPSASAPRASARRKTGAAQVAKGAAQQLLELTGKEAEGVTSLERTDDGWKVQVEVVEVRRIPDTTDVLALYEVTVDDDGDLESYKRLRRYTRGKPGDDT